MLHDLEILCNTQLKIIGVAWCVVGDLGRFHRREIDESMANRRRSIHFRGVTWPSRNGRGSPSRNGCGIGLDVHSAAVDAHSAAVNAVNGPAIHQWPRMIFN